MTTQLLLYEKAVPVTKKRHGDWSVKTGTDYSFARRVNSVPLLLAEFQNAAAEFAIVFTETDDTVMPAIILGIRGQENLFVAEDGRWLPKYVPAFMRRYPFVFSSSDEGASFTLCIDEDFSGCNQEGRGERLFDSQGERTLYLENMLGFLQAFQVDFHRTRAFCEELKRLELLEPMQAQFSLGTGQQVSLAGFSAINRERLNALSGDKLEELAKVQGLEPMFAHLFSLKNFSSMVEKAIEMEPPAQSAKTADTAPAAVPPNKPSPAQPGQKVEAGPRGVGPPDKPSPAQPQKANGAKEKKPAKDKSPPKKDK